MHTVVELDEFIRQARLLMSDDERERLIGLLAAHPESGTPLGGGLRKLRIARPGSGKSGGFRTVYLFVGERVPVLLLSVFAKNRKDNLTPVEQRTLVEFGKRLAKQYGGGT